MPMEAFSLLSLLSRVTAAPFDARLPFSHFSLLLYISSSPLHPICRLDESLLLDRPPPPLVMGYAEVLLCGAHQMQGLPIIVTPATCTCRGLLFSSGGDSIDILVLAQFCAQNLAQNVAQVLSDRNVGILDLTLLGPALIQLAQFCGPVSSPVEV